MIKLFKSKLVEKKEFGSVNRELVYIMKFEIEDGGEMEFRAGQFVNVMLPNKVARAYSIVGVQHNHLPREARVLLLSQGDPLGRKEESSYTPPFQGGVDFDASSKDGVVALELCVEYIPSGIASEFFRNLQIGDEMIFKSPFGRFVLQEEDLVQDRDILFIGTGTGIVPFVGMVEELIPLLRGGSMFHRDGVENPLVKLSTPSLSTEQLLRASGSTPSRGESINTSHSKSRKITILHGVPYEELNYYDEFFKSKIEIARQVGIDLIFERWVSRPSDNFTGNRGRVSVHIDAINLSPNTAAYICGGNEAIQSIREHLIGKGIKEENIRTERFH